MNRIEQIKLIAEFMDSDYQEIENLCRIDLYDRGFRTYEILSDPEKWVCYHNDFSCLMEVVEKIESLGFQTSITHESVFITYYRGNSQNGIMYKLLGKTKLEAVYLTVIEFIEWYNGNNK